MDVDVSTLADHERYKLLAGLVVPRPIAWVTTVDVGGTVNLAPYSFFQVMSTRQCYVGLGIQDHDDGRVKDTLRGIQDRGEYVVNLTSLAHVLAVDRSADDWPRGVSEVTELGLETVASSQVSVPRLAVAPAALECRLVQVLEIGDSESWVVGRVVQIHVDDEVVGTDLRVDYATYRPLGRLIARQYVDTRSAFTVREAQ
jgi:flavin reductase (DIM6/NTAB) family NADH-FMN oxidoreductase RutF